MERLTPKCTDPAAMAQALAVVDHWLRDEVVGWGLVGSIDDYPIGGRHRGQCKLWVEFDLMATKGIRFVKQTTNKLGVWCAPKRSTFQRPHGMVVNTKTRGVNFLRVNLDSISLQRANGETFMMAEAPHWTRPKRVAVTSTYKIETLRLVTGDGEPSEPVEMIKSTIPADPPALCDAYELWEKEVTLLASKCWQRAQEGQVAA